MLNISKTEQSVLKCIIKDRELITSVNNNFFLSRVGTAFYDAFRELYRNGLSFTDDNILIEANKRNSSIDKNTIEVIKSLDVDLDKFTYYFKELRKNYAKQKLNQDFLNDTLLALGQKDNSIDDTEMLRILNNISNKVDYYKDLLVGKDDYLLTPIEMFDRYENALHLRNSGLYKYTTGCFYLDKLLRVGFSPGKMTFMFGASGTGKSIFCLHLIDKLVNLKIPSLYFSPENDTIMTCDRWFIKRNGLYNREVSASDDHLIDEGVFKLLRQEKQRLSKNNNFFFVEKPSIDINDVKREVLNVKKRTNNDYIVVFIDLFTMLREFSGGTPQEYEDSVNKYHILARELNVHLVGVLQAGRQTDNKILQNLTESEFDKFRPNINDIKNSASFRERGRIILSVFRKKYYAEIYQKESPYFEYIDDFLEVQVVKQNEGDLGGKVYYLFDPGNYSLIPFDTDKVRELNATKDSMINSIENPNKDKLV